MSDLVGNPEDRLSHNEAHIEGGDMEDRNEVCHQKTCFWALQLGLPGSCPLHLLHLSNLSFMIGMPNRCYILELRVNQYVLYAAFFVCLGANAKLDQRKPN